MTGPATPASAAWPLRQLLAFRIAFAFFGIACTASWTYLAPPRVSQTLESLNGMLPAANEMVARWVIVHVLRLPAHSELRGAGHPLPPVVLLGVLAFVSVLSGVLWSFLQRRATNHNRLWILLHTVARYSLAATMLGYGFAKLWPVQFGEPGIGPQLTQVVGDMTPYGLLWFFMGSSRIYAGFAGAIEALAGVLLLGRRTAGLGALVALAALVNVAALDVAYGVPVLHIVTLLILLAVLVAGPTVPRVVAALVGSGPVPGDAPAHLLRNARHDARARVVGMLIGCFLVIGHAVDAERAVVDRRVNMYTPSAIRGVWQVDTAQNDGHENSATQAGSTGWHQFAFVFRDRVMIREISGRTVYTDAVIDTSIASITLIQLRGRTVSDTSRYRYFLEGVDRLSLVPQSAETRTPIRLRRLKPSEFRLTATRDAWVW